MDPQAVLTRLLSAYLDNDRDEWNDARKAYNRWRERGGFTGKLYSTMAVDLVLEFGWLQLLPNELDEPARVVLIAPARYGEEEEGRGKEEGEGEREGEGEE